MISNTDCYSCKKYGEYCEYANMYGNCLSTACKKVTPVMSEFSPVLPDYRIVHRKDGVYDLYDSLRWQYVSRFLELESMQLKIDKVQKIRE